MTIIDFIDGYIQILKIDPNNCLLVNQKLLNIRNLQCNSVYTLCICNIIYSIKHTYWCNIMTLVSKTFGITAVTFFNWNINPPSVKMQIKVLELIKNYAIKNNVNFTR